MSTWRVSEETKQRFQKFLESELTQARVSAAGYQFAVAALTPELEKLQNKLQRCSETVSALRTQIDALPSEKTSCHSKLEAAMQNYDRIMMQSNQCLTLLKQLTEEFNGRLERVEKFSEIFREIPAVRMPSPVEMRQAGYKAGQAALGEMQRTTQRV